MDAQQLLNHSKSKDFHSEDETGYAVPHPRILAEDDSDCESTATLPDNPSPPVYQGENVGEVKTPAKRRQTGGHLHPKRQKLLHGGLSCNALDFISYLIDEDHVECGNIQLTAPVGVIVSVEFSKPNPDPDVVVKIGMEKSGRVLQGQLHQVERVLNPLLREDLCAYNALRSFCYGKRHSPCEDCQRAQGLFKGCYKLRNNRCANVLISEVESNV